MLTYGLVVLGVSDVPRAERFWRAALGYERHVGPYGGFSTVLVPPAGIANAIALQPSDTTPDKTRPRMHLDLHAPTRADQEAEAERLVRLGATRIDWDDYPAEPDFIVLSDPDGNLFCIVELSHD